MQQGKGRNPLSPARLRMPAALPTLGGKQGPVLRIKGPIVPVLPLGFLSKQPSRATTPERAQPTHQRMGSLPFFSMSRSPPATSFRISAQRRPSISRTSTLAKVIAKGASRIIPEVSVVTNQGSVRGRPKKENQDASAVLHSFMGAANSVFVAVCDGHGENGHLVSRYIASRFPARLNAMRVLQVKGVDEALKECLVSEIIAVHREIADNREFSAEFSGSTLLAAVIHDSELMCANVGDSRAILIYTDHGEWYHKQLTVDHKPDVPGEKARIEASHGRVRAHVDDKGRQQGPVRVWAAADDTPGLAMSRSIGDTFAHAFGVSEAPDISVHCILPEDRAIVLASDGLWDAMKNSEVTAVVAKHCTAGTLEACGKNLVAAAEQVWKRAGETVDDITVAVVWLRRIG